MKVNITKTIFDEKEEKAVAEVLRSGWIVQGPKVAEFENLIADYSGSPYTVAVSNCTTGLHVALVALGVGRGDEVIVPAFTFVATANACEYVGAKPVFVDVSLDTFNIDVDKIEEAITPKTKAIMPVHLFGLSADMGKIMEIAKKHDLVVIEDAACAIGTKFEGKHVGYIGEAGAFSFHPRKTISTGEGGMLFTAQKELAMKFHSLRDHGAEISDLDRHKGGAHKLPEIRTVGFNYRMTDIQGAIGVEQVKKLPGILEDRIKHAEIYNEAFKDFKYLRIPQVPAYSNHAYQSYVMLVSKDSPLSRDEISTKLTEMGIATRQGTQNVAALKLYQDKYGYDPKDLPNTVYLEANTMTIPLYAGMTKEEQNYVIDSIKGLF